MKIYTKTGDKGDTSLAGGQRVAKDCRRIEAIGSVDELNAHLGLCRSLLKEQKKNFNDLQLDKALINIQNSLFLIGAQLAESHKKTIEENSQANLLLKTKELEQKIDSFDKITPPLTHFILPGGGASLVSQVHVSRTVCRRAERLVISLRNHEFLQDEILIYMNRLSDFLFSVARFISHTLGEKETIWDSQNI